MCDQFKSTHPEGCPQFGKVICSACERPNHASLFCQIIKIDVKNASDTSFPSKSNRHNKRDREYKGEKVRNKTGNVNLNLKIQTQVKRRRIKRKRKATKF